MFKHNRYLHTFGFLLIKKNKLPPRAKFTLQMENECIESFMHGGRGPGGQKINKCNSKVQLKHLPTGIVVSCQETRAREQNRKIAREKMALEIERLRNKNNYGTSGAAKTDRELALQQWHQQTKKSKVKKSKLKHELHASNRLQEQLKQQNEDEELIKQILQQ